MTENSDQKAFKEVNFDSVHPDTEVQYEAQYDPNNDYAIFGIGDPTRGGIQTMQEKMNIADKPMHTDSSEEEEEHGDKKRQSTAPSGTVICSKGEEDLRQDSGSTGGGSRSPKSNSLPEDKEIHSDDE